MQTIHVPDLYLSAPRLLLNASHRDATAVAAPIAIQLEKDRRDTVEQARGRQAIGCLRVVGRPSSRGRNKVVINSSHFHPISTPAVGIFG